jgi:uncharacterized protein YbcI
MRGSVVHDVTEQTQRSPAVAISNAIVQIYKEGYGKGATRARTRIDDDVIVVTLEDIYTPVEHTLIASGEGEQIRETRRIFQQAHRAQLIAIVEDLSGRRVYAYLSQVHFDPDLAVEVFLVEPEERE